MKKIKGILLFGILILLGIGSSFGANVMFFGYTNGSGTSNYFNSYTVGNPNLSAGFVNSNGNQFLDFQYFQFGVVGCPDYNIQNYLTDRAIQFNRPGCGSSKYIGSPTINDSSSSVSYIYNSGLNFNYLHIFYFTNKNYYDDYFFLTSSYLYNMSGTYLDIPGGLSRKKVLPGLNKSYSSISVSNGQIEDYSEDYFQFSFVPEDGFQDGGLYNITGIVLFHFNSYLNGYLTGTNTIILFKDDSNIYYNLYNEYSDSLLDIVSYTPISVGTLSYNGSNGFSKFQEMVFDSGALLEFGGSSISFSIKSFNKEFNSSAIYNEYTFDLSSDNSVLNWFDFINGDGGNGNQSTGSIAINTGLLNLCLNDLQFGELNSYLCNQLLSNLGNPVQIPGTSGQYISVSIDENGNLRYWITTQEDLAEQMSGFIWVENDDGSWSTVCPSGDCLGTVLAQPINHGNTGFVFSTGDVLDMMSNLTGWVGRCPFPYTDFRLGKNLKLLQLLQDYGFNYDPFIIINCSVAGFQYGRHTIDNTLFGDTFEHPLLYGDTPKHRTLFVFLDFVVILGLFGLFAFIKKIF